MKPTRYDLWVERARPKKQTIDAHSPVTVFVEEELLPDGQAGKVLTVILSNRECPYRCVYCGLWQETLDHTSTQGAVADQVAQAIAQHGDCDAIKLYNAGSFFDEQAISPEDRVRIGALCDHFRWVIVESRPELIDERATAFAKQVRNLQIAIGLEIADDEILAFLNKRMTLASVAKADAFMIEHGILWRAFVMIQPPLVDGSQAIARVQETIRFAQEHGAQCVSLIRSYATPGVMEELERERFWHPPDVMKVYEAARWSRQHFQGVTLVDRWSLRQGPTCDGCIDDLDEAFRLLNTTQELPAVTCGVQHRVEPMVKGPACYRGYLRERMADKPD